MEENNNKIDQKNEKIYLKNFKHISCDPLPNLYKVYNKINNSLTIMSRDYLWYIMKLLMQLLDQIKIKTTPLKHNQKPGQTHSQDTNILSINHK